MVLNARKYAVYGKDFKSKELERNELRTLLLLSDNYFHDAREIMDYTDLNTYSGVWRLVKTINKKMDFELIKHRYGKGYYTGYKIEIDY